MKCTRQVSSEDKKAINRLRLDAFNSSRDFDLLSAEKLKWSLWDDEQTVLAVWNSQNEPVSTMRAVVVHDAEDAQACLQCTVSEGVRFPAMVFNAAATRKENRGEGLNQVIRYYFLHAAIRDGIEAILSPIYKSAPRKNFMTALGYEFVLPQLCWQTKLRPKSERILGILPRDQMAHAIDYLKTHRGEAIDAYPWQGELVALPVEKEIEVTVLERRGRPLPVAPIRPPLPVEGRPVPVKDKDQKKPEK